VAPLSLPRPRVAFFVFFFFAAAAVVDRVPSVSAVFDGRVFSLLAPLAGEEVATDPSSADSTALTPPLPVLKQRQNIVDANCGHRQASVVDPHQIERYSRIRIRTPIRIEVISKIRIRIRIRIKVISWISNNFQSSVPDP
jgi:hypothetical protein